MERNDIRNDKAVLRSELANWQRGAVGLLILTVVASVVRYTLLILQEKRATQWEDRYRAVVQIERETVQACANLAAEVEMPRRKPG